MMFLLGFNFALSLVNCEDFTVEQRKEDDDQ